MINKLKKLLTDNSNIEQAQKMSAYMKDLFPFAGIPKPKLNELIKPFLKETSKLPIDWDLVFSLWDMDYREAQYIALEYIQKHHKELLPSDIDKLNKLIVKKSWWETVDTIDGFVGEIVLKDPTLKNTMLTWSTDDNIWLRRIAIDFQQKYKEATDTELLKKIICNNLNSKEFFINKAIGWSLREYSKTAPSWVDDFVTTHKDNMTPLSIKEATKLI